MNASTKKAVKPEGGRPNLRTIQKNQTRARILEASLKLFYEGGYHATTVDQIAAAISAARPTFYLHFPDKQTVLQELCSTYLDRLRAQMERLPGPQPSRKQIDEWMVEMVEFVRVERASISLIVMLSSMPLSPPSLGSISVDNVRFGLAKNVPAFDVVAGSPNEYEHRAAVDSVVAHFAWAAQAAGTAAHARYRKAALSLAADDIEALIARFS